MVCYISCQSPNTGVVNKHGREEKQRETCERSKSSKGSGYCWTRGFIMQGNGALSARMADVSFGRQRCGQRLVRRNQDVDFERENQNCRQRRR